MKWNSSAVSLQLHRKKVVSTASWNPKLLQATVDTGRITEGLSWKEIEEYPSPRKRSMERMHSSHYDVILDRVWTEQNWAWNWKRHICSVCACQQSIFSEQFSHCSIMILQITSQANNLYPQGLGKMKGEILLYFLTWKTYQVASCRE